MNFSGRRCTLWLVTLALGMVSATGCGYTLVGRASNIPDDIHNIYVSPFENRTPRSQVEQVLTRAVTDELVTRPRFSVVSAQSEADAELRGVVVGFVTNPVGFAADGRATEYEITLTAQVVFQRVDTSKPEGGDVIWRNDRYTFRQSYDVSLDAADYFNREDEAIEDLSKRFSETMVTDLLEGF